MGQMTESIGTKEGTIASFYDALAPDYDTMTSFEKRFIFEKPFFRALIEQYRVKTAIDAGCGTGFHSLLLAQLGIRVVAVDISEEMLRRVALHAREMKMNVTTIRSTFEDLMKNVHHKVDAVFSMGNSLAHVLSDNNVRKAIRNFSASLNRGGILFVQNLNYDRILANRERIQSIREIDGKVFVRFYDYIGNRIRFNILTIRKEGKELYHKLAGVPLRPIVSDTFVNLLNKEGFNKVKLFGSIAMEPYKSKTSHDLVVLAQRK